jgi:hypothetical protein
MQVRHPFEPPIEKLVLYTKGSYSVAWSYIPVYAVHYAAATR